MSIIYVKQDVNLMLKIWNWKNSRLMKIFLFEFLKVYLLIKISFSSVQFSRSVVSDSLRPHESQHARPPCPSPTPGVCSYLCPSSRWCHPAISCSVVPFSSCPQTLPVSGSFPMSQLFAWGGQSTGVLASASVLPVNSQDWSISFRMVWLVVSNNKEIYLALFLPSALNFCETRTLLTTHKHTHTHTHTSATTVYQRCILVIP